MSKLIYSPHNTSLYYDEEEEIKSNWKHHLTQEEVTEWIAALRSGTFAQGRERLCTIEHGDIKTYCCLGVKCALMERQGLAKSEIDVNRRRLVFTFSDKRKHYLKNEYSIDIDWLIPNEGMLPTTIYWKLSYDRSGKTLASLNDAGIHFLDIAWIIEQFFTPERFEALPEVQ